MEDKQLGNFTKSVLVALTLTAILYTVTAVYGYLTFGVGVASDMLELYGADNAFVLVGILAMALKIITTYPILTFCGRSVFCLQWARALPL